MDHYQQFMVPVTLYKSIRKRDPRARAKNRKTAIPPARPTARNQAGFSIGTAHKIGARNGNPASVMFGSSGPVIVSTELVLAGLGILRDHVLAPGRLRVDLDLRLLGRMLDLLVVMVLLASRGCG